MLCFSVLARWISSLHCKACAHVHVGRKCTLRLVFISDCKGKCHSSHMFQHRKIQKSQPNLWVRPPKSCSKLQCHSFRRVSIINEIIKLDFYRGNPRHRPQINGHSSKMTNHEHGEMTVDQTGSLTTPVPGHSQGPTASQQGPAPVKEMPRALPGLTGKNCPAFIHALHLFHICLQYSLN